MSFKPDLAKFKMTHLDTDAVSLMTRRAYDIAGCIKGVAVHLNGTKIPVRPLYKHDTCIIYIIICIYIYIQSPIIE